MSTETADSIPKDGQIVGDKKVAARVLRLIGKRKPYPWGAALGISRGTIGRMLNGYLPMAGQLACLVEVERVNLSWLFHDEGPPYLRHPVKTDDDAIDDITEMSKLGEIIVLWSAPGVFTVVHQLRRPYSRYTGPLGEPMEMLLFPNVTIYDRCLGQRVADYLRKSGLVKFHRWVPQAELWQYVNGQLGPANFCNWVREMVSWRPSQTDPQPPEGLRYDAFEHPGQKAGYTVSEPPVGGYAMSALDRVTIKLSSLDTQSLDAIEHVIDRLIYTPKF